MTEKWKRLFQYGKIMVDISVPQVNSRLLNILYDDRVYFVRMMDGEFYDIVDITNDTFPRFVNY